ncbi:MAG: sodium-dependent transporter [Elusimicrobia bacterium]|nr:sodium-dependent transporter [Elusimicrobiota bacterium]
MEYFGEKHRAQWKTKVGFILAAMGSAIGLGNIWRFSYLCYENGGGAFLIPYFVALLVVGIPVMVLEFSIGHRERGSAPLAFHKLRPSWEWLGWWAVIFVMFGIMLYYSVVISWCVNYFRFAFNLSWGKDPNTFFFKNFLGLTSGPGEIGDIRTPILLGLIIVWLVCWVIVFFGVEKGIERANKILIPLLFFLTLILVIWAVSLPGAKTGITKYLKPDFKVLLRPQVWISAFSQIFFTLSLGFGIMIAYASYLPHKTDITQSAILTSIGNCIYSLIAGFAVWGTLGYMATAQNLPIEKVVKQSIGLAFVAYPQAISLIPTFSKLFGVLFFTILTFAGITSGISIIEAFSSAVIDKFHSSRKTIVSVLCILGFLGSIFFATGAGLYFLDIVDHFLTSYGLVVVGFLECIFIGWIYKTEKIREHINDVSPTKIGKWWDFSIKYITPVVLLVLLITSIKDELSSPYGNYPVSSLILLGRDWVFVTFFAALLVMKFPWKKKTGQ